MRDLFFLFLLSFTIVYKSMAQTCCSGGVPLSSNLGLPNEGKGIIIMGLNYDYNNLNTLNAESSKLDDNSRQRITNSILLNLGYSITDKLAVEALLSWVNQTRTITQFGNEEFTGTSGIGDAVFLVKYSLPNVLGKNTVFNFGLGTKAPFGKSDIKSEQGIQLTADLQPGSGAWDGLGWLSISKGLKIRPSATISGSLTHRLTGVNNSYLNNAATYEFGDEIQANIGYTDQVLLFNTLFNPGLIFKYRKAFEDKIDSQGIPNTGGEWVFIRPEITVKLSQNISINTRYELPIYSVVEGTQLTPTSRFTTGISFKLETKKKY
ncbi:transporter [Gelidibacter algens]|uniref:transporter n=1 Tax=Gelidibacter algens TaxID=49280 RepID=UPI0012F9EDBF|nr:transporter [Gelidibacter algens]